MEVYGTFLLFVIIALTTSAGVGGDILLIPIIRIFFNFQLTNAIAL